MIFRNVILFCLLGAAAFARRSLVVQRSLPRPADINMSVLRSRADSGPLTDLQKAEELIKREMLTMLHFDSLKNPITGVYILKYSCFFEFNKKYYFHRFN